MKKSIALILALVLTTSTMLVACSANKEKDEATSVEGLEAADNEFGFETVEVTDENGKTVTDKNGNAVTTEVNVEYVTNKKGKTFAKVVDENGNQVTNKKGKDVTIKTDYEITTDNATTADPDKYPTTKKEKTTASTTVPTKKNEKTTEKELTTVKSDKDSVPKTSQTGKPVTFSSEDQQAIKKMLEVPYLYKENYENEQGVPIEIATHAALWMASREGLTTSQFASGTIVLDLFKYFGQTVINFKTNCNSAKNPNLTYVQKTDTFSIGSYEDGTHTITITEIQDLGNNNYYKVIAKVSGCKKNKVVAIVQKNMLDSTLGFSIKALKWS